MNQLTADKRRAVIAALVEGNSIRATVRMTGVAKNTVTKLLVDLGKACEAFHDRTVRNLNCDYVECDEIWSFVYAKERNVPAPMRGQFGVGDVYTWTAIDAESKLAISFLVGLRTPEFAQPFIQDVADRLAHRVQLTTDGHHAYLYAIYNAFHGQIDYSMLQKIYGKPPQGQKTTEGKYSPPACIGQKKFRIWGKPDDSRVSTSYVERQNLSMRMHMRRFTRLTNGFSKKVENLAASVALWFLYYNFARVHMTLKTTPAVAAGIADHAWTLDEIIALLDLPDSN